MLHVSRSVCMHQCIKLSKAKIFVICQVLHFSYCPGVYIGTCVMLHKFIMTFDIFVLVKFFAALFVANLVQNLV